MKKRFREIQQAVTAAGFNCESVAQKKSGHLQIVVSNAQGVIKKITASLSPSDGGRNLKNIKADIKRAFLVTNQARQDSGSVTNV